MAGYAKYWMNLMELKTDQIYREKKDEWKKDLWKETLYNSVCSQCAERGVKDMNLTVV